ncbi:alpha/beta hydrolase [bacterium]|nr:alpha/beta hydrolase [bacterium]
MMKRSTLIYCIVLFFVGHTLYTLFAEHKENFATENEFFNIGFLHNTLAVRERLTQDDFADVSFTTSDNIHLAGLFLDKSKKEKIKGTILCCAGFHPGLKEGMSTYYALVKDEPYNVLLYDARGHGQSDGSFYSLSGLAYYGQHEYLDVIAALEWIQKYNELHKIKEPIFIIGLCAGAFHATRAIATLKEANPKLYTNIKGLIFDSGWGALYEIAPTTINGELEKRLKRSHAKWLVHTPLYYMIASVYYTLFYYTHAQCPTIHEPLAQIDTPILFIHAHNDKHVPIRVIEPLTQNCKNGSTWFIQESTHACHHLKHAQDYKKNLLEFVQKYT